MIALVQDNLEQIRRVCEKYRYPNRAVGVSSRSSTRAKLRLGTPDYTTDLGQL
jgi:hypothetical protein